MGPMGRTNVVVDDELIGRVMDIFGFETKREAIDYALRQLVGEGSVEGILALQGTGWEGDLDEMRDSKPIQLLHPEDEE